MEGVFWCFGIKTTSTQTLTYNGLYGWDGSIQSINIPSNAQCVQFDVKGGGGAGYINSYGGGNGGNGDFISAIINLKQHSFFTLYAVVAGYTGTFASGGGLSGIFSSQTPSKNTTIIVSGGGGGAGSQNGFDAKINNPNQPSIAFANGTDGAGGLGTNRCSGTLTPFLSTLHDCFGSPNAHPAFGGGSNDLGVGAGGGIPGGNSGMYYNCTGSGSIVVCHYYSGGGGTSYVNTSIVSKYSEKVGQGGQGGTSQSSNGEQGSIVVDFY